MSALVLFAGWSSWLVASAPWCGVALVTIALLAGFRKRWKSTPVLVRCVVVSLYAHLFFATAAYTTEFVWGPAGLGGGSGGGQREMRVRVVAEFEPVETREVEIDETPPEEAIAEIPPELAPATTEIVERVPRVEPTVAKHPEPVAPPTPVEAPVAVLPAKPAQPLEALVEAPAEIAPRYAESVTVERQKPSEPISPSPPQPLASASPAVPDMYKLRFSDRSNALEAGGGSPDTEAAVQRALVWLVATQDADGHWSAAKHEAGRGTPQQGQNRGDTGADADTGVTALALLALLGAGHTHLAGEHRLAVQHGLEYLLAQQRGDGSLAGNAKLYASMYCHGMATLALAEAMAITRDARLRPFLEKAVAYTVSAQHSGGGWRYQPGDVGDTSQFGWQLMALKSAELAGVNVPDITKQRAAKFLQTVSSGRAGGLASYRAGERASRTMTAEALLCRHLLGQNPTTATTNEATSFLLQELPTAGAPNVYYWYYGTLALRFSRGVTWETWNAGLQKQLLGSQRSQGNLTGSWDPDRVWGGYGGRVYQTSLSTLCLESYYRYDTALLEGARFR